MRIANILLLSILLFSSACYNPFNPKIVDVSSYEVHNRSPIELLQNLEKAYSEKKINLFKQLLHKDFRFELLQSEYSQIGIDMDGDNIPDSWWGYEEEIEFTRNMFERGSSDGLYPPPDRIELRLRIPPTDAWQEDETEGHEDWVIIPSEFNLILRYNNLSSQFVANGTAIFYVVPTQNSWKIIIWRDESLI